MDTSITFSTFKLFNLFLFNLFLLKWWIKNFEGLYNDALIAANLALEISPTFVVSHFTLANIYASKLDLEKAKLFYIVSKFRIFWKEKIFNLIFSVDIDSSVHLWACSRKTDCNTVWWKGENVIQSYSTKCIFY